MALIQIGKSTITSENSNVYIIAEIGQNHQGSIEIAKDMIIQAKQAGCDCVKFQKSCLSEKFTKSALNRLYDNENSWGKTYGEHKEYLEFSLEQYKGLQSYCNEIQIDFTASAMDEVSLMELDTLNVPFIKIGSGDANNFPLLEKASQLARPLIISTGMQTMDTINAIVQIMERVGKKNFALLHCVSSYPTNPEDVQLQMIKILKSKYPKIIIGYSGHEIGIQISLAAVLMGARILERHITLNKIQKGSDHKCSLNPDELKILIEQINVLRKNNQLSRTYIADDICNLIGSSDIIRKALKNIDNNTRNILSSELSCKHKLGKSVVARKIIKVGDRINMNNICIKVSEPNGIPAENLYKILGKEIRKNINEDEPIEETSFVDFV